MGRNTRYRFRRPNGNETFALLLLCVTLLTAWWTDFRPRQGAPDPHAPAPIARYALSSASCTTSLELACRPVSTCASMKRRCRSVRLTFLPSLAM